MSLDVAIQSVLFYVLSCSTCAKINHRRKAKVRAKKEREEKQTLETEQPGLYRHPSPFATNPYWAEEISMGPNPPKKKGDKGGSKNASQRALNTAGPGSSYAGSGVTSTDASSPTAFEGSRISGEGWNLRRYQREDEELWGHDTYGPGQRIMDAIAKAGSTAGRLIESRLSRGGSSIVEENPKSYYLARNPPVNDLHPPVVSTPASRDETRWMLQPPPSAKVMEGKERVNRNRADSNGSSRRGGEGTPLGRQVTERLTEAKLQRGETPSYSELRSQSSWPGSRLHTPNSARPVGHSHEADNSSSAESSETRKRRKRKAPPISLSTSAMASDDSIENIPSPATTEKGRRERPPRPVLTTINSSRNIISPVSKPNSHALREISPLSSNSALNSRPSSPANRISPHANSMPASIPRGGSKFPGADSFTFPKPVAIEGRDPACETNA